jgi:hypothetical protein
MTRFSILVFALVLATVALADPALPKLPPPDAAALKEPLKVINEVYQQDWTSAKTADQRAAVSKKLIDAAKDEKDVVAHFALLSKANDFAIEAGDIDTSAAVIDQMDAMYLIDALKMRADGIRSIAATVRPAEQQQKVVTVATEIGGKAVIADRYDIARSMAEVALSSARYASDADMQREAVTKMREVREIEAAYDGIKPELAVLGSKPTDPNANLKVGKFRCFIKGDWDAGLPMLALGSEVTLKALATKELTGATDADSKVALGDGWLAVAEKETGTAKSQIQNHIIKWYSEAVPALTGLAKARVEQRIEQMKKSLLAASGGPAELRELVVEALIDGDSELWITQKGIYWKELGVAKPGRHDGRSEPTLVNGVKWFPQWGKPREERGFDTSALLPLPINDAKFAFEVIAVSVRPDRKEIERRDPVTIRTVKDAQVISIPDHQSGAMWYTIRLFREKHDNK